MSKRKENAFRRNAARVPQPFEPLATVGVFPQSAISVKEYRPRYPFPWQNQSTRTTTRRPSVFATATNVSIVAGRFPVYIRESVDSLNPACWAIAYRVKPDWSMIDRSRPLRSSPVWKITSAALVGLWLMRKRLCPLGAMRRRRHRRSR